MKPVTNEKKLDGFIVDFIEPDDLIGADATVLIDLGSEHGVKVGNRVLVIRRGDAYTPVMKPGTNVGQDDDRYPARAIGEVMIVQAGKQSSVGVVSFSTQEFGVGDRVFMRQGH